MSLFKKLAGQTVVYGFGHVLGKVLNYVLIAFYLTRKLTDQEAEYGIYNEMYFYVAILLILLGLRMETTFFRFGSKEGQRGKAFGLGATTMLITGVVWFTIALVFGDSIAATLSYPERGVYIKVLSALLAVDLLIAMPLARMRLEGKPGRFVLFQSGSIILNIALVLFLLEVCPRMGWHQFFHREDIILDVFIANLLARGVILILLSRDFFRIDWVWDLALWKKMLNYAWPLVLVGFAGVINQSSYIILQKYFLGGELMENLGEGGVYAAAAKIALLMSIFVTAYNFAAEPFFFNQAKREDAPYIYAQMTRAFSWISALIFLVITLFLDVFQNIVDTSYRSMMYVVPVLLLGYVFLGLYYNVAIWYKVSDNTKYGALISIIGAAVTFGINLVLLPLMGVIASAWASLACYVVMLILCWYWGRKKYPVPYEVWPIFKGLLIAIILVLIGEYVVFSIENPWLRTSLNIILVAIFIAIAYISEKKKWTEWMGYN